MYSKIITIMVTLRVLTKLYTVFVIVAVCSAFCYPQEKPALTFAKPEEMGMTSAGLEKINGLMQKYVEDKKLPGIVTMIARHGHVVSLEKYGVMKPEIPMRADAIFRIASMTKPITSVAAMILYDEGRFQLDDPVSKYIPEFKDTRVFTYKDKDSIHTEAQKKPMTIRNLLMHTSGLGSGGENSVIDSIYRAADLGHASLKDKVAKLAKIPLKYQPETRWCYSYSTDVLGRLVEILSGKTLDAFSHEKIFVPLKMFDIGYSVSDEKLDRVPSVYCPSGDTIGVIDNPEVNYVSDPPKNIAGNGGLLSSAADYMIFSQMLLNRGSYNGARILKFSTVDMMIADQITDEKMPDDDFLGPVMHGMGYGLGFCVFKDENITGIGGTKGSYWWSGTANTYFLIDPKEDLIMIFMTQFVPNYHYPVFKEFRALVYKSIIN